MPFTLTMPKLSPTMEQGTIVKWHKKEGDKVEDGDLLFEVATDKATVEHNAIDAGILRKILVPEGSDATVNQAVAIFTETADESIEGYQPKGQAPQESGEPKEDLQAAPSEQKEKRATKTTGTSMAQPEFQPPPPLTNYQYDFGEKDQVKASPLAKKLAKEQNLNLEGLKGSGPNGRIVSKDLEFATSSSVVHFGSKGRPQHPPGSFDEIELTQMRKTIAERLQSSKTFIPHFYVQQTVDASAMMTARGELKDEGIKVTFNDFVVKAVALSLKKMPEVNRGFNTVNNTITQYKTIDLSIAVSIDEGLITPIVRYADYKNLMELSKEIKSLAKQAKDGKLQPEQFIGGSFTISNLGMFGIKDFQAVINPPQAGILAVGGILDQPVVKEGKVVPGKTMELSLSVDHRVIDGALAAAFINQVKYFLERPSLLLI